MKFVLKKGIKSVNDPNFNNGCNLVWLHLSDEQRTLVNAMASVLSDRTYHEICHQLNGKKSEFDGADDGEVHMHTVYELTLQEKKAYAIKSALYRGIFGSVLTELKNVDEEALDEDDLDDLDDLE